MATDYGVDIAAIDGLPDPEVLASGDLNVAYALARRLLTPSGALDEIGETEEYDCLDVRDWLGGRFSTAELSDLQTQVIQVLLKDDRVSTVDVSVAYLNGAILLTVIGTGANGPFRFVLSVSDLTVELLRGG